MLSTVNLPRIQLPAELELQIFDVAVLETRTRWSLASTYWNHVHRSNNNSYRCIVAQQLVDKFPSTDPNSHELMRQAYPSRLPFQISSIQVFRNRSRCAFIMRRQGGYGNPSNTTLLHIRTHAYTKTPRASNGRSHSCAPATLSDKHLYKIDIVIDPTHYVTSANFTQTHSLIVFTKTKRDAKVDRSTLTHADTMAYAVDARGRARVPDFDKDRLALDFTPLPIEGRHKNVSLFPVSYKTQVDGVIVRTLLDNIDKSPSFQRFEAPDLLSGKKSYCVFHLSTASTTLGALLIWVRITATGFVTGIRVLEFSRFRSRVERTWFVALPPGRKNFKQARVRLTKTLAWVSVETVLNETTHVIDLFRCPLRPSQDTIHELYISVLISNSTGRVLSSTA